MRLQRKLLPFSSMLKVPSLQLSRKKFWSFYTCGKATNAAVVGRTSPNSLLSMRRSAAALLLYLSLSFSSFSFLHGHGHGQVLGFLSLVLLLRSDLRCFATHSPSAKTSSRKPWLRLAFNDYYYIIGLGKKTIGIPTKAQAVFFKFGFGTKWGGPTWTYKMPGFTKN